MCLHPINAWKSICPNANGNHVLHFTPPSDPVYAVSNWVKIPCGKCIGCIDDRRKRWINRLLLEFDHIQIGTFITLTYRDAPEHPSKSDAQKFVKRLRHAHRDYGVFFPKDFKYFLCAERGSQFGRPHYHALLFGVDMMLPEWKPYIATFKDGYPVWSSKVLEHIWPHGYVTIGEITPSAIRYVAKYTVKTFGQEDTFTLKSMRLGCGKFFNIDRIGRSVRYSYKHPDMLRLLIDGYIHLSNGRGDVSKVKIPSAYDRYVEAISPFDLYDVKLKRSIDSEVFYEHVNSGNYDVKSYVGRLLDNEQKDKLKRKLDYEKARV